MAYALTRALTARTSRFNLVFRLAAAHALWRQRRALASLDAHARRDLGLSEDDIHAELRRPLWDVPPELALLIAKNYQPTGLPPRAAA